MERVVFCSTIPSVPVGCVIEAHAPSPTQLNDQTIIKAIASPTPKNRVYD